VGPVGAPVGPVGASVGPVGASVGPVSGTSGRVSGRVSGTSQWDQWARQWDQWAPAPSAPPAQARQRPSESPPGGKQRLEEKGECRYMLMVAMRYTCKVATRAVHEIKAGKESSERESSSTRARRKKDRSEEGDVPPRPCNNQSNGLRAMARAPQMMRRGGLPLVANEASEQGSSGPHVPAATTRICGRRCTRRERPRGKRCGKTLLAPARALPRTCDIILFPL
jgi:hypothetical protein